MHSAWALPTYSCPPCSVGRAADAAARSVIRSRGGFIVPYLVFCAFCVAYSSVSGSLVAWGSAAAAGSGIPEIKTYLNGVHVPGDS